MRWLGAIAVLGALLALLFWMQREEQGGPRIDRPVGEVDGKSPVSSGPDSKQEEEREEGELLVLFGVVVNEDDAPVPGAVLKVERDESDEGESATTDDAGRFRFEVRAAEYLAVRVSHVDYVSQITWFVAQTAEQERTIVLVRGARYGLFVVGPDREPIEGAEVDLFREEQHGVAGIWDWSNEHAIDEGKTDAEGGYPLGVLPLGTLKLKVAHPGFAVHRETLEVTSEESVDHLVVLNRGGVLEGKVVGPEGELVADARVFTDDREGRTDTLGRFRIERVGAGPATVQAEKEGFGPGFFGASLGWDEAIPVQVVAGETVADIVIELGKASWIVGRLVDGKGAPVAEAEVHASVWGAHQMKDQFASDKEGRFVAGPYNVLGDASIHLYIRRAGFAVLQPKSVPLAVGQRLDVGDLKLVTSPPLRGRVVDADDNPVAGAKVRAQPGWTEMTTGADGAFELPVWWPRKITVTATGPGPEPHRAIPEIIDASPGKPRTDIVLKLIPPLSITGQITDGAGGLRSGVTLIARRADVPDDARSSTAEWAHTDEKGRYRMTPLAPGRYKIGVVGMSGNYIWGSAAWLTDPTPREVDAGEEGVDFVFPYTGGIVTAKVVSKRTGRPIRSIRYGLIRYRMLIPRFATAGAMENREGRFRTELRHEGSWAVEFQADGHASYRTPSFSLKKGESKDLGTIRLGEGATLVGQVRDAQGLPVPYTRVNILSPKFETNDNEPYTGRDGRFRIPSISPGLYNIFAVSPRHPVGMVRNVNLFEGKTTEVEVRFVRPAPLEITVRNPNGQPIEGARLSWSFPAIAPLSSELFRDKIPPGYGSYKSDASGVIYQHSLPAGPVTLSIEAQGFTAVTKQVRLVAGKKSRVEFTLTPKK
ncbi:MAG: carboxypeptidase-like regulatory domain-containing protein [Planctomycetota bacterium]